MARKIKSKRAPAAKGEPRRYGRDAPGMRGWRSRVGSSGRLRQKRSDTKVGTLEKIYHKNIGKDSLQLQTLLHHRRKKSLKKLVK